MNPWMIKIKKNQKYQNFGDKCEQSIGDKVEKQKLSQLSHINIMEENDAPSEKSRITPSE